MDESRRLGRWRLVEGIDETRHSVVWLGEGDNGDVAAIKVLKARRPDAEPYRRFRDEVAFHLGHPDLPGVLPLLDAHAPERLDEGEHAWLAMPVAKTVRLALGDEPSLEEVAETVAACAHTLAALAEENVFHRDLKPSNLFERDRQWLVGDFGLVTWPDKQELTEAGDKLGPAHFIAPEMVTNPEGAAAGPADVWSLAKTLWVLAAGQNYPPPGQLRVDQEATSLRVWTRHPRAARLEPILEMATALDPEQRPSMAELAGELDVWLTPPIEPADPPDLRELAARVRAIVAPAERAEQQRLLRDRATMDLFERLRDHGVRRLYEPMEELAGRVLVDEQSLVRVGLGGGSGRRDAVETAAESLTAVPPGRHSVSLTADVAYELFENGDLHLVAGLYVRSGQDLPEKIWIETRQARLGTETALRQADELTEALTINFAHGARRFTELLEQAEEEAQRRRQHQLESEGANYVFRTEPENPGGIVVYRKSDGSRDGFAVAWPGTPLVEIRADGDRLYVRTERTEGWISRSYKENWSLSAATSLE